MGLELVNKISIKENGVYLSTRSSNCEGSYHSVKIESLTKAYEKEGQVGLDKAIIDMCLDNIELRGSHESVYQYIEAFYRAKNQSNSKYFDYLNKIRNLDDKVMDVNYGIKDYKNVSEEERNKILKKLQSERANLKEKLHELVLNEVRKYREDKKIENSDEFCEEEENEL